MSFDSYKKITQLKRLPLQNYPQYTKKPIHSIDEATQLLYQGDIIIEEKIDGTPKIMTIPESPYIFYGEYMYFRHTVFYDKLPAFFIVYDIWNTKTLQWELRPTKEEICHTYGYAVVPLLYQGNTMTLQQILHQYIQSPYQSAFSTCSVIEGVVIKNYTKNLFGKIIRNEFLKILENAQNYRREHRLIDFKYNRLKKS